MAEGGEDIPLVPMTDDQDDGDDDDLFTHDSNQEDGETTQPFKPDPTSTPYPESEQMEMHTLPREQSGLPNISFDEDTPDLTQRLQKTRANSAWNDLTEMFPNANKAAIETLYEKDKKVNPRLYVKMVGSKKKAYPLFTQSAVTRQLRENPKLSQEVKSYLGKSMFDQMKDFETERNKIQQELQAKQKQKQQMEKQVADRDNILQNLEEYRNQIRHTDDQIQALEDQHGTLNVEETQKLKQQKRSLKQNIKTRRNN